MLIILSTVLYNAASGQQKRVSRRVWLLCAAVFVLNGFVSILSKMHQVETVLPTAGTFGFAFWSSLSGMLLTSVFGVVLYRKCGKSALREAFGIKTDFWFVLGVSAFAACVGGFSYLLQLFGAELLPATVLYPAVTGGKHSLLGARGISCFSKRVLRRCNGSDYSLPLPEPVYFCKY